MIEKGDRRLKLVVMIALSITTLIAIGALVVSLLAFQDQLNGIQTSRFNAAEDSCALIQSLSYEAAGAKRQQAAQQFLKKAGLDNCYLYANRLTHINH